MDSPSRRYEKERTEEYVDRRDRRTSPGVRSREMERKESHRHREYEKLVFNFNSKEVLKKMFIVLFQTLL